MRNFGWGCKRSNAGMTMLEVCMAAGILASAVMAVMGLFLTSERMSILSREESIAMYAASEVINEIRAAPFSSTFGAKVVADYNKNTRPVNLDGPNATKQRLSMGDVSATGGGDGKKVTDEMGILIVNEESPNEADFGDVDGDGDIDFPVDLNLDGSFTSILSSPVAGQLFPLDLGGDATLTNETIAPTLLKLVPMVVVVRWNSMARLERRIQVLTLIADRSGLY